MKTGKRRIGKGVLYVGGQILGEIPENVLDYLRVIDSSGAIKSHAPHATRFLKKNKFFRP